MAWGRNCGAWPGCACACCCGCCCACGCAMPGTTCGSEAPCASCEAGQDPISFLGAVSWYDMLCDLQRSYQTPTVSGSHRMCLLLARDVKQAVPPLALAQRLLPNEVLLRVAGDLRGRPRDHIVPADAAPVALQMWSSLRITRAGTDLLPHRSIMTCSGAPGRHHTASAPCQASVAPAGSPANT